MALISLGFTSPELTLDQVVIIDKDGNNILSGSAVFVTGSDSPTPYDTIKGLNATAPETGFCRVVFKLPNSLDIATLNSLVVSVSTGNGNALVRLEYSESDDPNTNDWQQLTNWLTIDAPFVAQSYPLSGDGQTTVTTVQADGQTTDGVATGTTTQATITTEQPLRGTDEPLALAGQPNACITPMVSGTVAAQVESKVEFGYSGVIGDVVLASACVKIVIPKDSVQAAIVAALQSVDWAGMVRHEVV